MSGSPPPIPLGANAIAALFSTGDASMVQVDVTRMPVQLITRLAEALRPLLVEGTVAERDQDGTVRLRTQSGDLTLRLPVEARPGRTISIQLPPTPNLSEAVLARQALSATALLPKEALVQGARGGALPVTPSVTTLATAAAPAAQPMSAPSVPSLALPQPGVSQTQGPTRIWGQGSAKAETPSPTRVHGPQAPGTGTVSVRLLQLPPALGGGHSVEGTGLLPRFSATIAGTDAAGVTRLLTAHGEVRLQAPVPLRAGTVVTLHGLPAAQPGSPAAKADASGATVRAVLLLPSAADPNGSGRTPMTANGHLAPGSTSAARTSLQSPPTTPGHQVVPATQPAPPGRTATAHPAPGSDVRTPAPPSQPSNAQARPAADTPEPPPARAAAPTRAAHPAAQVEGPRQARAADRGPESGQTRTLSTLLQAQNDRPAPQAARPVAGTVGRVAAGFTGQWSAFAYGLGEVSAAGINDPLPSLRQTLTALAQVQPALAEQVVRSLVPQANAALPATVLLFLSAMRGGDIRSWLGDRVEKALEAAGRSELFGRLAGDFAGLSRQGGEPQQPGSDWRSFPLPFLNDGALSAIRISLGRSDEDGANEDGEDEAAGTRFVIDLALSRLGPMQLDGTLRLKSLALTVRSHRTLPLGLRRELGEVLDNACGAVGLAAGLTFQAGPTTFRYPAQDR